MTRLTERISKLEAARAERKSPRRVVRHVLDCEPAEREARIAAIEAADPDAFNVVRVIVRPGEEVIAA